ncbi:ATP-binding cassette domain-containing protein [Streptomyces sp. NPDC057638]|uniref:ATP-binding cassette domain-containing protein n=1 Tax=Streptomyces sp. NPDC057638 TaxID=3346190 RepID=UPI003686163A
MTDHRADPPRTTRPTPLPHTTSVPPAIETEGLTKSYGRTTVLDGVDLRVAPGSVFALLGQNGAGKTTTVRLLTTLTTPDAGHARVAGFDVVAERARVRRSIGLTGQYAAVDERQTGEENLRLVARLRGMSRPAARRHTAELIERFDLTGAARRPVATYSGGMRRRLDLAAGLVGEVRVVFLDEPTTGLDPRGRAELWRIVAELSAGGATVFLTTQYLEEADRLADRIAVLDGGRLVAQGTADELKARVTGHRLELVTDGPQAWARVRDRLSAGALLTLGGTYDQSLGATPHAERAAHTLDLPTTGEAHDVRVLLDLADPDLTDVRRFTVRRATLDDVFMALTAGPTAPEGTSHA